MIIEAVVAWRRIAQPVSALVVGQHAIAIGEDLDDLVPDPRIGTERIGERHGGRAGPPMQPAIQQNPIDTDERHRFLSGSD